MPLNAVVERYRQAYPDDERGDEELTLFLGDLARANNRSLDSDPEFKNQYLDLKLLLAPSIGKELTQALSGGFETVKAKAYDTLSLAGKALEQRGPFAGPVGVMVDAATGGGLSRRMQEIGQEGYQRNLQEAGELQPTIQDVRDVRNVPEAIRYGVGLAGQQAPQLVGTIGAGMAGMALGGPPGAALGAGGFSFTQSQIYGELANQIGASDVVPTAIGVGALNAVLDSLVPLGISKALFKETVKKGVIKTVENASEKEIKDYLGRVIKHVPINALTEGSTESLQEITSIAGELYSNRNVKGFKITPEEIKKRVVNSAVAGVLLGGGTGAIEAAPRPREIGTPPLLDKVVIPKAAEINSTQAGTLGYFTVDQPMVDELSGLAIRELEGTLPPLEKASVVRGPEIEAAYEAIKNNILDQIQAAQVEGDVPAASSPVDPQAAVAAVEPEVAEPAAPAAEVEVVAEPVVPEVPAVPVTPVAPPVLVDPNNESEVAQWITSLSTAISNQDEASALALVGRLPTPGVVANSKYSTTLWAALSPSTLGSAFVDKMLTSSGVPVWQWRNSIQAEPPAPAPTPQAETKAAEIRTKAVEAALVAKTNPVVPKTPPVVPVIAAPVPVIPAEVLESTREAIAEKTGQIAEAKARVKRLRKGSEARGRLLDTIDVLNRELDALMGVKVGGVPAAPAPVAPAPAPAPVPPVIAAPPLDTAPFVGLIDWDPDVGRGLSFEFPLPSGDRKERTLLVETITKGARDKDVSKVDPKTGKKTYVASSLTRRVTFFRNAETGQIHGVGTFGKRDGEPNVVDPGKKTKRKGTRLNVFLAKGTKADVKKALWEPVASVRFITPVFDYHIELTEAQWQQLADVLKANQDLADAKIGIEPASRGTQTEQANIDEQDTVVVSPVIPAPDSDYGEQVESGLSVTQVKLLWDTIFANPNLNTKEILEENVEVIRPLLDSLVWKPVQLFLAVERGVNAKTFDTFYEAFDPTGYRVYKLTTGAQAQPSQGSSVVPGGAVVAPPVLPVPAQATPQSQAEAVARLLAAKEGKTKAVAAAKSKRKFTISGTPAGPLLSSSEVGGRFNQVIQALRQFGVNVDQHEAIWQSVGGETLRLESGGYASQDRLVTLAMFDMLNPSVENLQTVLHEAAHALFDALPRDQQVMLYRAIRAMSNEALGLSRSRDPRLNAKAFARLPNAIKENLELFNATPIPKGQQLAEERLVEWLALEGMDRTIAAGVVARLIRFIKDMYYRAMIGVQQLFGRTPSNALALAYAQNRFEQMLAAGVNSKSILEVAIAPRSIPEEAMWYEPVVQGTPNERLGPDGKTIVYPLMTPDSQSARDFNNLYSLGEYVEYEFSGGPKLSAPGHLQDRMIELDRVHAIERDFRQFWSPSKAQESIDAGNEVLDAKLRSKGLMHTFGRVEKIGDRSREEVVAETHIAAYNAVKAVEIMIAPVLEQISDVVAIVNKRNETRVMGPNAPAVPVYTVLDWFRQEFGLDNPDMLIQDQLRRIDPTTGAPTTADPNATVDTPTATLNRELAAQTAYKLLNSVLSKISLKDAKAINGVNEAEKDRKEAAEELIDSWKQYLNIEGLTRIMKRQVTFTLRRLFRDLNRESINYGVIAQQLRELQGRDVPRDEYLREFRRLTANTGLYQQLMGFLDRMATDPAIDLEAPINDIRQAMLSNPQYASLIAPTTESRALLATLVAYAKTNPRLMALLNLRRMRDTERRIAINSEMELLLKRGLAVADRMGRLTKVAVLEDKLKRAFDKDRRAVEALQRKKEKFQLQVVAATNVMRYYDEAANRLAGRFELHAPFIFADGSIYYVPQNPGDPWSEVVKNPKNVKLDSNGEISDRASLENDMGAMNDWLAAKKAAGDLDGRYFTIRAMRDEIANQGIFSPRIINTQTTILGLALSDAATIVKSFGTPAARMVAQMINRFTAVNASLVPEGNKMGRRTERARAEVVKILSEGRKGGVSLENYKVHFYDPAVRFLEHARDILELPGDNERHWAEAMRRLFLKFQAPNTLTAQLIKGKEPRFMAALRRHIEAEWAVSRYQKGKLVNEGVGVTDETLPVTTPTGEKVAGVRKHREEGLVTIPKTISKYFDLMFKALTDKNWAAFKAELDAIGSLTPEVIEEKIQPFFNNDEIQRYFFGAIATMDTESAFTAPSLNDRITKPEANPNLVSAAYQLSQGNVNKFIEAMYKLHDGNPERQDLNSYAADVLNVFSAYFSEYNNVNNKLNPSTKDPEFFQWSMMIPGFMVNARKIRHWPAILTNYIMFDRRTIARMNARIAAEVAFGVEQERLAKGYETMLREADGGLQRLDNAMARVADTVITDKRSVIEAALAKELGGADEVKRLRKLQQKTRKFLTGSKSVRAEMFTYFRGADSPVRSVRFMQQLVGLFSSLMLNQPGSALTNLADLFSPFLTFGVSGPTIKAAVRNIGAVGMDGITGLISPIGLNLALTSRMQQRYNELGMGDPLAVARLKDLVLRETSPFDGTVHNRIISGMRKIQEAQEFGVGKGTKGTVLRPLAMFRQIALMCNRANVCSTWNLVNDFVMRGMEAYATLGVSDDVAANWTAEEWAKALDLGKLEANSFKILHTLMLDDWGLDFFRLVKEGRANANESRDVLSDATLVRLQGMAMKEITSETNPATMPLASFNSTLIKFISPLLGWPYRRAMKVAGYWKDPDGKGSYAAVANALMALAVAGGGGLGVSMLVDLYNEEVLRKRRNLRRLTLDDPRNLALAIVEHSARVGTLGFFGDALNEGFNVGTGEGANRGISLDQRIVFVSSALGIIRSFGALSNQDWQADYSGVVRPLLYSMGGNGAMQYMQAANGLFERAGGEPLSQIEAAATRRTNVGNWLRASGRQLDFEVETASRGYGTPTAVTPHISKMVLAAYADDPSEFVSAYREAIRQTRESRRMDYTEAEKYVKRAFSSRHPLRATFRSALSERDYHTLLNAMPDSGREDVSFAISMFNRYGDRIGVKPFSGNEDEEKTVKATPLRLPSINVQSLRSRAVGAALGF